jgi:hypothetical protein
MIDEAYCFQYCDENRKDCSCGYLNGRCDFSEAKPPHYANMRCYQCGKHFGYIPTPESTKAKRPALHRSLVKKSGIKHCQMCLRHESQLIHPDTLAAHHVAEFCKGGDPNAANLWIVCTACHSLIHWARTYIGRGLEANETKEAS